LAISRGKLDALAEELGKKVSHSRGRRCLAGVARPATLPGLYRITDNTDFRPNHTARLARVIRAGRNWA